jgi:hypothetical protein
MIMMTMMTILPHD